MLFFLDLAAWTELLAGDLGNALSYFTEALAVGTDLAIAASARSSLAGAVLCHAQLGQGAQARSTWNRTLDIPIARQLHLSVRTVETHLNRIYRKLGVSGRHELDAALASSEIA